MPDSELIGLLTAQAGSQPLPPLQVATYSRVSWLRRSTLVTYLAPVPRIDLIREVLEPTGIKLERRTAVLTVAIMQHVPSRRGIAALPNWGH